MTQTTKAINILSTLRTTPGLRRAWPTGRGSEPANTSIECVNGRGRLRAGHATVGGVPDLLLCASDPTLPALPRQLTGRLVVHRVGRRVVVMEISRVRKIARPHKVAFLVRVHTTAASVLQITGLRTPRILDNGDDVVDLKLLPGRSLDELGGTGLPGWKRFTEAWSPLGDREADLPVHGPCQEAQVLQRWLASARRCSLIDQQDLLHGQVADTCSSLTEVSGVHAITHRDLHDGQFLRDGTDLSLSDLDTVAMAEAILDLGNLRAHADFMAVRGRIGPETRVRVRGLLDDLARTLPLTEQRLEIYYRLSALRLVFVHVFRSTAYQWLPAWVCHCLADVSPFTPLDFTSDWNDS